MRNIIAELYFKYIKKNDVIEWYNKISETQYWNKEQLENFQVERFKKLWKHAVDHVPYYKNLLNDQQILIDDVGDLKTIPILTKDIIRKNFNDLLSSEIQKDRFIKDSTSGSTGSNFQFYFDKNKRSMYKALEMRKYEMMGVSRFDRELIVWGTPFKNENKFSNNFKNWISNKKIISGYNLSNEGIQRIYESLISFKPKIIKSYPSILVTISEYFKENNLEYQPQIIHIGGEKLYAFQKEIIEKTFKCPVYDFYAARDMKQIACQCGERNGLHVFMENVIFEVIDEEGNPIEEGEGDIVLTDLHNYVMPFIRYKIGDRAKISKNKKCKCGRNLQVIDEIIGRTFEIIEFPNGNKVGGSFWTLVMRSIPGIKDFQVIKKEPNKILINYTADVDSSKIDFNELIRKIKTFSGEELEIKFIQVDQIPVTKAGKMQFVISETK